MKKDTYQECLDTIYRLGRFGIKLELKTISSILKSLHNPEKTYFTVHVAGTNGKGSTATYIASILQKAGFKTGLYTSPHLVQFNERISINGNHISNDQVVEAYEAVHAVDNGSRKATFFEITTAMGFYHFSKEKVDFAVIETGMGGRFDATNIIHPVVSVITNLSIEHTDYLGSTIKALAREKGGIIKERTPVVTGVSQPSGLEVLRQIARKNSSDLFLFKKDFSIRKNRGQNTYRYNGLYNSFHPLVKPLPGEHQKENLSIALAACELIFKKIAEKKVKDQKDPEAQMALLPLKRQNYQLDNRLVKEGLALAKWPGRLEHIMQKPLVILDGAHNLHAAKVLGKYLSSIIKNKKLTLVLGILDDKPYEKMLKHLVPLAHNIILVKAKIDRSLDPALLKKVVRSITKSPVTIIEDVQVAVSHAIETAEEEDVVCIAGSLYVAGEAKEKFDNDLDH